VAKRGSIREIFSGPRDLALISPDGGGEGDKEGGGGKAPRSVTLKVAPVQASLRCRTAEKSGEREGMIDRREMGEGVRKRERRGGGERQARLFYRTYSRTSINHT